MIKLAPPLRRHRKGIEPLPSRSEFAGYVLRFILLANAVLLVMIGIGFAGYHWIAGLDPIDSLLNTAMILTGMGPVDPMTTDSAKLFASLYALLSGAVYPVLTAVVLYPFVHRLLHRLHLDALDALDEGR
jgi:fumarate reductase subunit D